VFAWLLVSMAKDANGNTGTEGYIIVKKHLREVQENKANEKRT